MTPAGQEHAETFNKGALAGTRWPGDPDHMSVARLRVRGGQQAPGTESGAQTTAEVVAVPRNLCARIPDDVTDGRAAFTVLASIGLQGVRLGLLDLQARIGYDMAQAAQQLGLDF